MRWASPLITASSRFIYSYFQNVPWRLFVVLKSRGLLLFSFYLGRIRVLTLKVLKLDFILLMLDVSFHWASLTSNYSESTIIYYEEVNIAWVSETNVRCRYSHSLFNVGRQCIATHLRYILLMIAINAFQLYYDCKYIRATWMWIDIFKPIVDRISRHSPAAAVLFYYFPITRKLA